MGESAIVGETKMAALASMIVWLLVSRTTSAVTNQLNSAPVDTTVGRRPFTAIWNSPSHPRCMPKFNVDLDLAAYGIVNKSVIFYNTAIGLYPFVRNGVIYNGGLPQVS